MAILIVDDSDDMRISTKALLETVGYTDVSTVRSAREAYLFLGMDVADADRPDVDAILMDITMPHIDGIQACRHIKTHERLRDIPIIMVTARTDDRDLEAAFAAGAMDYITKPIKIIELLARLRSAMALKHELDNRKARQLELLEVTRQLREVNQMLERLSIQDPLTGVPNRRSFTASIQREWARAMREATPLSVIMMDVDYFKAFNDHYGHLRGDECLQKVAHALSITLKRPGDVLARYGGEEFVGLLTRTGVEGASAVAEAFRAGVERLAIDHERSPLGHVTLSVGTATAIPDRHTVADALIGAADQALYEAKREGRNRVIVFNHLKDQSLLLGAAERH